MPAADYSSYHQNNGTTSDGSKFNNFIDAVQATANGLDTNNLAAGAAIKGSQLATGISGPPGIELDYVQQTSSQTSTATTAATATAIVTGGSVTYDGATAVWIEFYAPQATHSVATTQISFQLYDGATDLGTIAQSLSGGAGTTGPFVIGKRRLTPSAAAHIYSIRMWSGGAGTTTAVAGAGGAGVLLPLYIRVAKV